MTKNETVLKESIEAFKNPYFNQYEPAKFGRKKTTITVEDIREKWRKAIIDQHECDSTKSDDFNFEDEAYALLINWFEKINWENLKETRLLFYYTKTLSSSDYGLNTEVLLKYHQQIQSLINKLILKADFNITPSTSGETENLGESVKNLVHLYFHHTVDFLETTKDTTQYVLDRKDMANLLPQVIKAFPKNCSKLFLYILEDHQESQKIYADLVAFYMRNSIECYYLASSLFSMNNKTSDFFHKNAPNIIKMTLQNNHFSEQKIDYLIDGMLLDQLNISSKERQIKEIETHLVQLKDNHATQSIINSYERDLSKITGNWDALNEKRTEKAIRRIIASKSTFHSVELITKAFPDHPRVSVLKELLVEVALLKNKKKTYILDTIPQTIFKDFHFKLLVIEELMYKQAILLPIFSSLTFEEEYPEKDLELVTDLKNVIEVERYFQNLEIPRKLLAKVTTLYQAIDLHNYSRSTDELCPDWDEGSGDGVYAVTDNTIEDLELLPNLTKIIGIEHSEPSEKLLKAFEAKGIILEEES